MKEKDELNSQIDENNQDLDKNKDDCNVCDDEIMHCDKENDARILELENDLKNLTDKYYRANADFENIKKRFEKEKSEIFMYASEKFAKDLLPVIDALEMALNFDANDDVAKKIKDGLKLTMDEFKKSFEKHGIKEIETNCDFDPNLHNAVLSVDSDEHKSGEIVQVMQKGYNFNNRVLRPAMVSISK